MAWLLWASQVVLGVKNSPANVGDVRDVGWIPGSGRSPGGGKGNPLQYSCLENPMDRGVWWTGVAKSQRWLKWLSTHTLEPFLFTSIAELWLGWLFSLDFLHKSKLCWLNQLNRGWQWTLGLSCFDSEPAVPSSLSALDTFCCFRKATSFPIRP